MELILVKYCCFAAGGVFAPNYPEIALFFHDYMDFARPDFYPSPTLQDDSPEK